MGMMSQSLTQKVERHYLVYNILIALGFIEKRVFDIYLRVVKQVCFGWNAIDEWTDHYGILPHLTAYRRYPRPRKMDTIVPMQGQEKRLICPPPNKCAMLPEKYDVHDLVVSKKTRKVPKLRSKQAVPRRKYIQKGYRNRSKYDLIDILEDHEREEIYTLSDDSWTCESDATYLCDESCWSCCWPCY